MTIASCETVHRVSLDRGDHDAGAQLLQHRNTCMTSSSRGGWCDGKGCLTMTRSQPLIYGSLGMVKVALQLVSLISEQVSHVRLPFLQSSHQLKPSATLS